MKISRLKMLGIALLANTIENAVLLLFFGIGLNRQILIGSLVFALVTTLLIKILYNGD